MRGGAQTTDPIDDDSEDHKYIFFYGCPPNSGIQANSNLSIEFFEELKNKIDSDGSVLLPTAMQFYQTEDGGSM